MLKHMHAGKTVYDWKKLKIILKFVKSKQGSKYTCICLVHSIIICATIKGKKNHDMNSAAIKEENSSFVFVRKYVYCILRSEL